MDFLAIYKRWKSYPLEDEDLVLELEDISENEKTIYECFYKDIEFGTGGLRGIMGVGINRMNIYTVAKTSQGYSDYLWMMHEQNVKKYGHKRRGFEPSVAIAYDSRHKSDLFAKIAASVFAANKISVYMYPELMPTPLLSFAVRHFHCDGGIVITASHNRAQYNGYKIYGAEGEQITINAAVKISKKIEKVDIFEDVKRTSFDMSLKSGKIQYIDEAIIKTFIVAVSSQVCCIDRNQETDKNITIVYTPLNGTGLKCVSGVLRYNGFNDIHIVEEQKEPDGSFPTCPYPNPEVREAMVLGLKYAIERKADILIATDPDCDRIGIAVKKDDDYRILSGNETGILLFDYICRLRIESGTMPKKPILVKTIVTSNMASQIAANYGVTVINVLTGFKFIGEQIGLLEENGEVERYIFGFEESCGYLSGSYVRDKDAIGGALLICKMYSYYKARGQNPLDVLESLYVKYGYHLDTLHSYIFKESAGVLTMCRIMEHLRNVSIDNLPSVGELKVLCVSDYLLSLKKKNSGEETMIDLPKANVIKFELEHNCSFVLRPSGTEPKLKLYVSICDANKRLAIQLEKGIISFLEWCIFVFRE